MSLFDERKLQEQMRREMEDDDVVATITLQVRRNGAMSVSGSIHHKEYAMAMCDAAKDAIASHHTRMKLQSDKGIIIPPRETPLIQ